MTMSELYAKVAEAMNGVIYDKAIPDDELFNGFVARIGKDLSVGEAAARMYACRALRPYVHLADKDPRLVAATGSRYVWRLKALVDGRFARDRGGEK